ncbi:MAG: DUF6362 family protein [Alphaproteobacteria bacterium]|nr:DUF6362 family protein [Alphaproteobacteria bacterium]
MSENALITAEKRVKERLKEAAQTLRRLPRQRLQSAMTSWPDVVRQSAEAYGFEKASFRPIPPRPDQISRMDEALPWLFSLDAEIRRIVWARAAGVPWRKLEMMDGRSHTTLRKLENQGVQMIVATLAESDRKNCKKDRNSG